MLQDEPADVFLRYSLAMELGKEGQIEDCLSKLRELMHDDPPYVPAFFMSAQQLAQHQRVPEDRRERSDSVPAEPLTSSRHLNPLGASA